MDDTDRHDRNPALAELLDDAYAAAVDVETAARHLWMIHKEAERLELERAAADGPDVVVLPDVLAGPVVDARDGVEADLVLAGGVTGSLSSRSRRVPRAAVPLLVVLMLMSSSGMALAASRSSLPGDVLYPVKRGTEHAQLIFARQPEARAQLQLAFAQTRLDEIRRIGATRPQLVPALVTDIAASLSAAEESTPGAVVATQRLREQTTQEIASLSLDGSVGQALDEVLAAAPAVTTTATATATSESSEIAAASTSTATPTPTAAGGAVSETSATVAAAQPSESGVPSESSAATPTPVTPPSTTSSGSPTSSEGSSASPTATATASPTAAPQPSASEGQVVTTPRPHPSGEGGVSRTEDEPGTDSSPAPSDQPDEQSTDGSSDQSSDQGGTPSDDSAEVSATPTEAQLPYSRQHD